MKDVNPQYAAESLMRLIATAKVRRATPVFGVFEGDVLVSWSLGISSAKRIAANCWSGERRVQIIGTLRH